MSVGAFPGISDYGCKIIRIFKKTFPYKPGMNLYNEISYSTSKLITNRYSTSFSISVRCLPAESRRAIYSIYGFVRLADEIVDTFHEVNQGLFLSNFERDFNDAVSNNFSMNPVLHSFAQTITRYNIPYHLVESFFKSMKADLTRKIYTDSKELDEYIYGSANVVGLMCLKVFVNGNEQFYRSLENPAMKLGSAFQKVNFLRDLRVDKEQLHRSYFPGLGENNNLDESIKHQLIENIKQDFQEAEEGIRRLPGRSKLAVLIAYTYYSHLLVKLSNTPAEEIMNKRIRLSGFRKILLLVKAFLKYQIGKVQNVRVKDKTQADNETIPGFSG
jgi:15-cis-phytoene synthase